MLSRRDRNVIILAARENWIGAWAEMKGKIPPFEGGRSTSSRPREKEVKRQVLERIEEIKRGEGMPTAARPMTQEERVTAELKDRMDVAADLMRGRLAEIEEEELELWREKQRVAKALEALDLDARPPAAETPAADDPPDAPAAEKKPSVKVTPEEVRDWILAEHRTGTFTTRDALEHFGCSRVQMLRLFKPMVGRIIDSHGEGKHRHYSYRTEPPIDAATENGDGPTAEMETVA